MTSRTTSRSTHNLVKRRVRFANRGMEDSREPGSILYAFNVVPSAGGLEMRYGAELRATLNDRVTAILALRASGAETFFAADRDYKLYDVTDPASTTVAPSPSIYSQDYEWFGIEFTAAGGQYLIATTDGDDAVWVYDHTEATAKWQPLAAAAPSYIPCDMTTLPDWSAGEKDKWQPGVQVTGGTSGATADVEGVSENGIWVTNIADGPFTAGGEALSTADGGSVTSTGSEVAGPGAWTITGATYDELTRPWVHRGRLWFVEPGELAAYYLPAGAFSGAVTRFPLQGVFPKGGALMAGGEVSSDSGSGMQSRCIFISTQGEVAVYEGDDPASWSLVGVYTIGQPSGPRAILDVGGDVSVVTYTGMTSVLTSVFAPQGTAEHTKIMERIRSYWDWLVSAYGVENWTMTWWPYKGYFLMAPPPAGSDLNVLVLNTRGQWTVFDGWPMTATCVLGETMLFGTREGEIANAEEGGKDITNSYSAWVAVVDQSPTASKMQLRRARATMMAYQNPYAYVWAREGSDLAGVPPYGDAIEGVPDAGAWGDPGADPAWGEFAWGAVTIPSWDTFYEWQGLNARGHECIIGASVLSNSEFEPRVLFQGLDWYGEAGEEPW